MTTPAARELDAARAELLRARATTYRLISRILESHPPKTPIGTAARQLPEPERTAALKLLAEFDGPDFTATKNTRA